MRLSKAEKEEQARGEKYIAEFEAIAKKLKTEGNLSVPNIVAEMQKAGMATAGRLFAALIAKHF